ncbi:hypothetical protein MMC18_000239 [Xylographa bjoerkii]|nr:hypothetical protein [Xylographa bjoerkii]
MVKQGSESMWSLIWLKILENHESIEYFAKARGLQWIDLLERNQNFKVVIDAALTLGEEKFPEDEVPIENPHTRVVPASGGKLRLPTSRLDPLTPQTMIDENIYDKEQWGGGNFRRPKTWPEVWPYPFNPMTRIPLEGYDENCACCGSEKICSCQLTDAKRYKDTLLELRDYGGRGVGVRTLQFIEAGTILGEYLGEIVPCGDAYDEPWNLDTVYGWEIQIDIPNGPRPNPLGTIAGKRVGNWCRYVNHSCDSSLSGTPAIVGAKRCLLYWANRDILPFEELTVDYGETYFDPVNNPCRCGEDNCYYSALEKDEKSDADEGEGDKEDVALKDVDEEELGEDDLETDIEGEDESHYYDYGDVV